VYLFNTVDIREYVAHHLEIVGTKPQHTYPRILATTCSACLCGMMDCVHQHCVHQARMHHCVHQTHTHTRNYMLRM